MNKKRINLLDFLIRAEHSQPYLSSKERLHQTPSLSFIDGLLYCVC